MNDAGWQEEDTSELFFSFWEECRDAESDPIESRGEHR